MVFFDYMLNKFCPYAVISFTLFGYMSFAAWQPYLIMAMVFFVDKFSFRAGYSVAYCESKGINPNDE